jgi:hypothetical protein
MELINKYDQLHDPTPTSRFQDPNYSQQRYVSWA